MQVHSFDLMMWGYSNKSSELLSTLFGRRFVMHPGDSKRTVPKWTRHSPNQCDVIFVDGDHMMIGAHLDMINMRQAAAAGAVAVADDINTSPGVALEALAKDGFISIHESYGPFNAPSKHNPCMPSNRGDICVEWGFALFSYTNVTDYTPSRLVGEARRNKMMPGKARSGNKISK